MNILDGLNDAQRRAVEATEGPLLILAGAGSGKTKTLTHRIAHLILSNQVAPWQILAVTFTNKAAREMRERLASLVGEHNDRSFMPWMGTFHSICVRLLRRDGAAIGIPANFVIYDEDDRQGLIKQLMKQLSIGDSQVKASSVSAAISAAKNALQLPDEYRANAKGPYQKYIAELYTLYEQRRAQAGALDFDDLLIEAVRLFRQHPPIRAHWRSQFRYILIDEYQDTNTAQYQLVQLLVNDDKNICVVGDDWQSIYSWRGADFTNILRFEQDFPGALVVKLEQNYRSTGHILSAAQQVIEKNSQRTDKKLWTDAGNGEPVQVNGAYDDAEEARMIAERISAQVAIGARQFDDFAVLYRVNSLSFSLERAFLQARIPYQVVGGVRFYDRKEIKDVIAYLRLLYQPNDRMSFSRIANIPTRGVGATSLDKFLQWQASQEGSLIDALCRLDVEPVVTGKAKSALFHLGTMLRDIQATLTEHAPAQIIEDVLTRTGYRKFILDGTPQAETREENIGVLLADAQQYTSLEEFLEEVALLSSADVAQADRAVTLMTLHAAKGLEFPVVFMVGLEEGVLPHSRVLENPSELEEERRLCYVGMTRARQELHLSYAYSRLQFGQRAYNQPSRFLQDMGSEISFVGGASEPQLLGSRHDEPFYSDEIGFDIGDRVKSSAFGTGEVTDIDGMAVTVAFDAGHTKKLNVEYAQLQKL